MTGESVNRLSFLDSSRGIAALIVLLAHFQLAILPGLSNSILFMTPFRILFDADAAVLYFFILSGFVLTRSVQRSPGLNPRQYFLFVIKRILRIYPAFILAFVLMYFTLLNVGTVENDWLEKYWTTRTNDLISLFKQLILVKRLPNEPELRLLPHDWTLSIEMAVSLLLPLLAFASRRYPALILIIIYAGVKLLNMDPFVFDFSIGVYLASLPGNWNIGRFRKTLLVVTGFILICGDYFSPSMQKLDQLLVHHKSIGLAMFMVVLLSSKRLQQFLSLKPLEFLGRISYSFYLLHFGILLIMTQLIPTINSLYFLVIYVVATCLLSFLSYNFIEKPYIRLGRRFSEAKR